MPDIGAHAFLPRDIIERSSGWTVWEIFRLEVTELVRRVEEVAQAQGLKYRKTDFSLQATSFLGSPVLTLKVPARRGVSEAEISAAIRILREEVEIYQGVHIRAFLPEGMPEGPEKEAAILRMRAAEMADEASARHLVRRALEAALDARPEMVGED